MGVYPAGGPTSPFPLALRGPPNKSNTNKKAEASHKDAPAIQETAFPEDLSRTLGASHSSATAQIDDRGFSPDRSSHRWSLPRKLL